MGSSSCNHNNNGSSAPERNTRTLRCACRYKVVKQLGDGTYGNVWKAINRQTNEVVSEGSPSLTLHPARLQQLPCSLAGFFFCLLRTLLCTSQHQLCCWAALLLLAGPCLAGTQPDLSTRFKIRRTCREADTAAVAAAKVQAAAAASTVLFRCPAPSP